MKAVQSYRPALLNIGHIFKNLRRVFFDIWAASLLRFIDHEQLGRTPLNEGSAGRRGHCPHNTNKYKRQTPMCSAGFEPAIPVFRRPQAYAFNHTYTGIGKKR